VGVEQNYAKAFELFYPLAQGGNPEAARFVGLMYFKRQRKEQRFKAGKTMAFSRSSKRR
jgi:TPR repeat protein